MDYLAKEINIKHFLYDEDYSDNYFNICVEDAKNKLKKQGLEVACSEWTTETSKNAIIKGYKHERSKFVYKNGYGMTTDIYMLPVGTKFEVINGAWEGKIVEINGEKHLDISNGYIIKKLDAEKDYCLAIDILK
jgi:hypothetical protein